METLRQQYLRMKGYNNSNMNSPNESMLVRYLRSGAPLDHNYSPSLNHGCPIGSSKSSSSSNLDDDVLVMDGILVDSNKASKSSGKFCSSAISDSSSSNSGTNFYKTESCVPWENTGSCRYGHKCQFAHGKEELRPVPNRARSKKKSDLTSSDTYHSPQSSTSSNSSKLGVDTLATPSSAKEAANLKSNKPLPGQVKNSPNLSPNLKIKDWCPLDDGIMCKLPSSTDETPSRKAVDEYINNTMLYGPALKTRLPVFVHICPK